MADFHHRIGDQTLVKMMDFLSECLDVKDIPGFKRCVVRMQELFDYHHSFCMFTNLHELSNQIKPKIEIFDVSYPKGLLSIYFETESNTADPVTKELLGTGTLQSWETAFEKHGYSYPQWAKDAGIREGLSDICFEREFSTAAIFSFNRVERGFEKEPRPLFNIWCLIWLKP